LNNEGLAMRREAFVIYGGGINETKN